MERKNEMEKKKINKNQCSCKKNARQTDSAARRAKSIRDQEKG